MIYKTEPWLHQQQAFDYAFPRNHTMLAMAPRTGKSKVTIDLIMNWGAKRILILCPRFVASVWVDQFNRHWHPEAGEVTVILLSAQQGKSLPISKRIQLAEESLSHCSADVVMVFVVNYDIAWRPIFTSWALKQHWDVVGCDESHRIKAPGGKSSRAIFNIGRTAIHRLCLTGTPMAHSPLDIYGQYRFMDSTVFGTNFSRFRSRYAVMGGFMMRQVIGYQNEGELNSKFYQHSFRVRSEDVLDIPDNLPPDIRETALEPSSAKIYRDLKKSFSAGVLNGTVTVANALTKIVRFQQITSGFIKTDDGIEQNLGEEKITMFHDSMKDLEEQEPVVVYARFTRDLDRLAGLLSTLGESFSRCYDGVDEVKEWESGGSRFLLAQIKSAAEGRDFVRSRVVIYYSLTHSLTDYIQSRERVRGPDQKRRVLYIHLMVENSIDWKILRSLESHEEVIEGVLRQTKEEESETPS